ncbi:MAG: 2-C-methyl-D-erythritol 2,4-cyclodiphosphate synthase [Clostridiaceae bacterium]|nr:2-C-methyl-D-erythritol 2,4-cyclodiphosphate synthase [Clostridiaceae bacterium]
MRIGQGYDSHKLVKGRPLILGGVNIPHETGLLGHSDADCLVHAIIDAIFGALGKGDIGKHFPDSDAKYKDIDSLILLKETKKLLDEEGYEILNIDSTVIIEKPKLSPYIGQMRKNIAGILGIPQDNVNVKAKSNEGMGFVGRGEGVIAEAVVLIGKKS